MAEKLPQTVEKTPSSALSETNLVQELLEDWNRAKEYALPLWENRIENFNLLIGKIKKRKYKSKANFHVPYAETLRENVFPLLTARLPRGKTKPRIDKRDANAAKLMQELITYTQDVNLYEQFIFDSVGEAMDFDTAWAHVCWDYQSKDIDHPKIELLDTFDVVVHPRKRELDDRWPIFIYREMTKQEMIEQGFDKDIIGQIKASKLVDNTYKNSRLKSLGFTDTKQAKMDDKIFPVIICWGKRTLEGGSEEEIYRIVIANEERIINQTPSSGKKQYASPYSHGKIPLAVLPYEKKAHMIYGRSFIDPIASQQKELNALENMKSDNYQITNNPPVIIDKNANVDLSTIVFEAGVPWVVDGINNLKLAEVRSLATEIDSQQQMVRRVMQDRTGANDLLLVSNDQAIKGGNTATGASIANENTKMHFRPHATRIDMYNQRINNLIIGLFQDPLYFGKEKAIAIADEDGNFLENKVTSKDISGEIEYRSFSASSLPESDTEKLQKAINIKTLYGQDQTKNQDELDKPVFEAAGYDWNKVSKDKNSQMQILVGKLKELTALANQPNFDSTTPQGAAVLRQIDNIKQMLGGGSNILPSGQVSGTGQPVQPTIVAPANA